MLHSHLTPEKWRRFDRYQQILMMANELNRAGHWLERRQFEDVGQAYERLFELIDLSVMDPKWSRGRRELLRLRDCVSRLYLQPAGDGQLNRQIQTGLIALDPTAWNMFIE
jgi:sulfur transfer protein SufE